MGGGGPTDGKTLAVLNDTDQIELWDTRAIRLVSVLETRRAGVSSIRFSPNSRRLAVGYNDSAVESWDLIAGSKTTLETGHKEEVRNLAFSSDGKRLTTTSFDTHMKLWDIEAGRELGKMGGQLIGFLSLAFSLDDRRLAAGGDDGAVTLWDVANPQPREIGKIKGHTNHVSHVSFLPDGDSLVSFDAAGLVCVWRAPSFAEIDAVDKAKAKGK